MVNIVYGAPYIPPAADVPFWSGLSMRWLAKGMDWPLTDPDTGIFMLPGVRGLGTVTSERHSTSSPGAPGSRFEGASFLDREVFWPLHVWHDGGSVEWMHRDRAFWSTMDPEDTGLWVVTHPDGKHRTLQLRFLSDGDKTSDLDPLSSGWDSYGITLVAEQPFWEGDPVVRSWKNSTYEPFFDPTGPQLVNIASGSDTSTASIDNPGDVESYPRWFVDDATTASVGVDGVVVDVPFAVPLGKSLVIESDPDLIGATLYDITTAGMDLKPSERVVGVHLINPVDKSPDLGEADFAPIPAGQSVPLSLTLAGSGAVEVQLPTRYRRPW